MEIEERARSVDQRRLYEAAFSENVHILDRFLEFYSDETPLHIAALRGRLDLTKELLKRSPNLATELDSSGRYPLHWASAKGHTDIVRELLQVNLGVCGAGDEDGRTPLHLAAIKGRVEVIREIVQRRPESIRETLDSSGETVLHLCVKHNHLKALKLLMESVINEDEFVSHGDNGGNTILHLASALKQVETIEYLVQIEAVKGQAKVKNSDGFTALDILEHNPTMDSKSSKIRKLLLQLEPQTGCYSWKSVEKRARGIWNKHFKTDGKWIEVARGNLIMAATITATVAFQAVLNPPGSVWQSKEDFPNSKSKVDDMTGTSILASVQQRKFNFFLTCNTVSFTSSVCIILMMISGFPVHNKCCMWALTLATCFTLTFMVITYIVSLVMLNPFNLALVGAFVVCGMSFLGVIALLVLILAIHLAHILVWTLGKLSQNRIVNLFVRFWKTVAAELRKPAGTDKNEPHQHQTA